MLDSDDYSLDSGYDSDLDDPMDSDNYDLDVDYDTDFNDYDDDDNDDNYSYNVDGVSAGEETEEGYSIDYNSTSFDVPEQNNDELLSLDPDQKELTLPNNYREPTTLDDLSLSDSNFSLVDKNGDVSIEPNAQNKTIFGTVGDYVSGAWESVKNSYKGADLDLLTNPQGKPVAGKVQANFSIPGLNLNFGTTTNNPHGTDSQNILASGGTNLGGSKQQNFLSYVGQLAMNGLLGGDSGGGATVVPGPGGFGGGDKPQPKPDNHTTEIVGFTVIALVGFLLYQKVKGG